MRVQHFCERRDYGSKFNKRKSREFSYDVNKHYTIQKSVKNDTKYHKKTRYHETSCDIMRYHVTTPRPYRDAQFTPAHGVKIKRTVGKQFMLYKKRNVKSPEYFQTCF